MGNGNYTGITKLANPVNDANDMETTLKELDFTVQKVLNGSLDEMENAIITLKDRLKESKNSYGFLYYAGHGIQSNGENFLIPVNANIQSESFLRQRAVSVQAMLEELNHAGNELNVIVLDACRDNPYGWNRSGSRGLQAVTYQPADSIIVFATSAGSTAADGTGRNGLFTGQLMHNLKTPGIDIKEVFDRTGAAVSQASDRRQIPAIYSQYFGAAYFGTRPSGNAPLAAPVVLIDKETANSAEQERFSRGAPVAVTITGDRADRIKWAFSEALRTAGLSLSDADSRYAVKGSLSLSEVSFPNSSNIFVRYEVNSNLIDTFTNVILLQYNTNGREGYSYLSEAENRAIIAAEKKIRDEFLKKLETLLSR